MTNKTNGHRLMTNRSQGGEFLATSQKRPGLIARLTAARKVFAASGQWRPQSLRELDQWMDATLGGAGGITDETALNFTAYFSGVLQISQTIGSCRLVLYERTGERAKVPMVGESLFAVLTKMANPYMDAYHFKEIMQHWAISWGNGYAFIQRNGNGKITALWPLYPNRTKIEIKTDGEPVYLYTNPRTNKEERIAWQDVFHLAGFGYDGLQGYSLIQLHQQAIGLGLSQQQFSEKFINNGAFFSGVFGHPKELSEGAHERLKKDIKERYGGSAKAGEVLVIEEGMTFNPASMPLKDAEFLGSKVFQIQEMARILNIPTPKLKDYSKLTYSNAEQLQIEYRTDTIRPWAERWEIAVDTQLLTPRQQRIAFAEFNLNQIARGDIATQTQAHREARYGGWESADDIRNDMGLNPIGGRAGSIYWMPTNMMDAENPATPSETGAATGGQDAEE